MTSDEYNEYMNAVKQALRRAMEKKWNPEQFGLEKNGQSPSRYDLMPVVKQRESRPPGFVPPFGPARMTLEQRLTKEDREFLADLKVGL